MHEELQDIPVANRQKMIPLFPRGNPYFLAWRSLRYFLVLLLPVLGNAVALWVRQCGLGISLLVGFLGAWFAAMFFIELCSGMASSNHGTYFRQKEPLQYWFHIAFELAIYLVFSCFGYFVGEGWP